MYCTWPWTELDVDVTTCIRFAPSFFISWPEYELDPFSSELTTEGNYEKKIRGKYMFSWLKGTVSRKS
jgi:hypothetical protein